MAQQNMNAVFYATTYHPIQAGSIDGTDTAAHDNGVYRALLAASTGLYDPTGDPKAEGDPYCTLFVGRLAHHTTEKTLHEVMSNFGRVKHLRVVRHIVTGASRGYAFVEFENENDMQHAYEVAQNHIIDGSSILVDYDRQKLMPGWIPRRLGGGLGGRKESGQLRFGGRDRPFRAPLRTIPIEQLQKLGIPLPPVGRYMSRFQLPSIPQRPESSKDHRQKLSYRGSPFNPALPSKSVSEDERGVMEYDAGFSSKLGRRSVGTKRRSSSQEHGRSRRRTEGDAEKSLPDKIDLGHEDLRLHKRRRHSEQDDDEMSTRSDHEDRESSRYRDLGGEYVKEHRNRRLSEQEYEELEHETLSGSRQDDKESSQSRDKGQYLKEHRKRSHSEQGDEQVDYENVTTSGRQGKERSRHHERSSSSSRQKRRDSRDHDTSSSRSSHRDKEGGHRHKRHRSATARDSIAEEDRSAKHGSEHSRHGESKHTGND